MAAGPANPALIPPPRSRARETARARRERRQRAEGRMIGQLVRATAAAAGSRAPASSLVRALRAALDAELRIQPRPPPHPPCEAPEGRDGALACGAAPRARARHEGDGGRGRATTEHAVAPARGGRCTGSGRGVLNKNDRPQGNQVSCHSECIPEVFYGVSQEGDFTKGGKHLAVHGSVVVPELGPQPELFGESCGALALPAYLMSTVDPSDAQAWGIHPYSMSAADPSDAQDGDDIKSADRPMVGLQPKPFGESCYGYRQGGIPTKNDGPQGDQDLSSRARGVNGIGHKMPGGMGMGRGLEGRSWTEGGGTHSRSIGMQSGQAPSPSGYFGIEHGRAVRFADTEAPMSAQ